MIMVFDFVNLTFNNFVIKCLLYVVVGDVVFGIIRAFKQKKLNSDIGLNGLIRKAAIVLAVLFFAGVDRAVHFNLVSFIPSQILDVINLSHIGMTEFIGIICVLMEFISILENMIILGVPIPQFIIDLLAEVNAKVQNKEDQ